MGIIGTVVRVPSALADIFVQQSKEFFWSFSWICFKKRFIEFGGLPWHMENGSHLDFYHLS